MADPKEQQPPKKQEMDELDRYHAGEPFNSAKLWQAMNDRETDALIEGIAEAKKPGGGDAEKEPPKKD